MRFVEFVVLALATWRIAYVLQFERGPFAVFARARALLGIEHDEDGEPVSWPDSEPGRLVGCIRCGSVWTGVCLVGLYLAWPLAATVLALPFALSAVAIAMEVMINGQSEY